VSIVIVNAVKDVIQTGLWIETLAADGYNDHHSACECLLIRDIPHKYPVLSSDSNRAQGEVIAEIPPKPPSERRR
jgi:hypothetical protein